MTYLYIRISGDMRVPSTDLADDVADAMIECAEEHGWGFCGVTRELTQEELDGQEPAPLTLEMVEEAMLASAWTLFGWNVEHTQKFVTDVLGNLRQQTGGDGDA